VEGTPIQTHDELKQALKHLGLNCSEFARDLNSHGIKVTCQAVWKWRNGRTRQLPGYVGFFLRHRYGLCKENLN